MKLAILSVTLTTYDHIFFKKNYRKRRYIDGFPWNFATLTRRYSDAYSWNFATLTRGTLRRLFVDIATLTRLYSDAYSSI